VHYKARLVAKGYAQREGIDYNEVFSPVVKHSSILIFLALVVQYDFELDQLGVKITFLHSDLDEEIYMTQPLGFRAAGKENFICKLQKSLYGLKQSQDNGTSNLTSLWLTKRTPGAYMIHVFTFASYQVGTISICFCMLMICS